MVIFPGQDSTLKQEDQSEQWDRRGAAASETELTEDDEQLIFTRNNAALPEVADQRRTESESMQQQEVDAQKHWRRSQSRSFYFVLIIELKDIWDCFVLHCKGSFSNVFSYNAFLIYKPCSRTKHLHFH